MVALPLGMEGERWLAFRRTLRRVRDGGPIAEADVSGALALVIELRTRADRIG